MYGIANNIDSMQGKALNLLIGQFNTYNNTTTWECPLENTDFIAKKTLMVGTLFTSIAIRTNLMKRNAKLSQNGLNTIYRII